jgi:hypothetical protein
MKTTATATATAEEEENCSIGLTKKRQQTKRFLLNNSILY